LREARAAVPPQSHAACLPRADATRPETPFSFSKKITVGEISKKYAKGFLGGAQRAGLPARRRGLTHAFCWK